MNEGQKQAIRAEIDAFSKCIEHEEKALAALKSAVRAIRPRKGWAKESLTTMVRDLNADIGAAMHTRNELVARLRGEA